MADDGPPFPDAFPCYTIFAHQAHIPQNNVGFQPALEEQLTIGPNAYGQVVRHDNGWSMIKVLDFNKGHWVAPTERSGWVRSTHILYTRFVSSLADRLNIGKPCFGTYNFGPNYTASGPPVESQTSILERQTAIVNGSMIEKRWVHVKFQDGKSGHVPLESVHIYQGRLGKSDDKQKPCVVMRNFHPNGNYEWLRTYYHLALPPGGSYAKPSLQGSVREGDQGTVINVSPSGQWTLMTSSAFSGEKWVPSNCLRIGIAKDKQGHVARLHDYEHLAVCGNDFDGTKCTTWSWMKNPKPDAQITLRKGDLVKITDFDENFAWVKVITFNNPSSEGWVRSSCLDYSADNIAPAETRPDDDVLQRLVVTKKGFTAHRYRGRFQPSKSQYSSFIAGEQGVVRKITNDRRWKQVEFYKRDASSPKFIWILSSLLRHHDLPCIATASFTPNAVGLENRALRVVKGDEVFMRFMNPNNWCYILRTKVPEDEKGPGFVPLSILKLGGARDFGDRVLEVEAPAKFTAPALLAEHVQVSGQGLRKHLRAVLQAWRDNLDYLPFWGSTFREIVASDQSLENFLNRVIQGFHEAGMLDFMSRGSFTFEELMNARRKVETSRMPNHRDYVPGVYVIGHWDFPGEPERKGLYCGQSGKMCYRLCGHSSGFKKPTSSYQRAVQHAKSYSMIPLCIMRDSTASERRVAEQLGFVILQTFRRDIYSVTSDPGREVYRTGNLSENSESAIHDNEDEGDSEDDDDDDEDDQDERPARSGISYAAAQQAAFRLSTIANAALRKTGWPSGGRPWEGLNFSPPATESVYGSENPDHERIWVKTQLSENILQFRLGNPNPVIYSAGYRIQLTKTNHSRGGEGDFFSLYIRNEDLNNAGINMNEISKLTVVAELKLDGQHSKSWARLPAIGPYDDWKLSTGLAFKIEFVQGGKWYQMYVQKVSPTQLQTRYNDPIEIGTFQAYINASNMVAYFLQRERRNLPFWHEEYGVPKRMREQVYDHLNQRITVREIYPQKWARPSIVSPDIIGQAMEDAGALNVGEPFGSVAAYGKTVRGSRTAQRKSCDACALSMTETQKQPRATVLCLDDLAAKEVVQVFGRGFLKRNKSSSYTALSTGGCMEAEGSNGQCTRCWLYGRPCSWTNTDQLRKLDKLQVLLMHQKPYDGALLGGGGSQDFDDDSDDDSDDEISKPKKELLIQDMNMRMVIGVSAELDWTQLSDET